MLYQCVRLLYWRIETDGILVCSHPNYVGTTANNVPETGNRDWIGLGCLQLSPHL